MTLSLKTQNDHKAVSWAPTLELGRSSPLFLSLGDMIRVPCRSPGLREGPRIFNTKSFTATRCIAYLARPSLKEGKAGRTVWQLGTRPSSARPPRRMRGCDGYDRIGGCCAIRGDASRRPLGDDTSPPPSWWWTMMTPFRLMRSL